MDSLLVGWLIPIVGVPVVVVVVVLGSGSTVCGTTLELDPDIVVNAPTNLRVRAAGPKLIHLTWDDASGRTAQFKSIRLEEFSTTPNVQDAIPIAKLDDTSNLAEGTTYFYTVRAT